jgi:hypothetical protein
MQIIELSNTTLKVFDIVNNIKIEVKYRTGI